MRPQRPRGRQSREAIHPLIKLQKPWAQTLASGPHASFADHGRNSCVAAGDSNQIPRSARGTIDMGGGHDFRSVSAPCNQSARAISRAAILAESIPERPVCGNDLRVTYVGNWPCPGASCAGIGSRCKTDRMLARAINEPKRIAAINMDVRRILSGLARSLSPALVLC
jgi:hypothetical protein